MIRPKRRLGALALALVCAALGSWGPSGTTAAASAPARTMTLEVIRTPAAASCAGPEEVRERVRARLGRQPFDDAAPERVRVIFDRQGAGHHARIVWGAVDGAERTRSLRGAGGSCADLSDSVALALAVAIDPLAGLRPPAAAPRGAPRALITVAERAPRRPIAAARARPPTPPPPGARPSAETPPPRWEVGFGVSVSGWLSPGVASGPDVAVALAAPTWLLRARAGLSVASAVVAQGARVTATVGALTVEGCGRMGPLELCGRAAGGGQWYAGGGVTRADPVAHPWASVGAGLGVRVAAADGVDLVVAAHVDAPLVRARVRVDGATAWEAPPVALGIGIGVAVRP